MFDNKWQRKEMPLVSLIGMGGGIASPAFLASIVLNILKPTVFSPADDTGVPDFDYTAESSTITSVNVSSVENNVTTPQTDRYFDVAYGGGKYVAVGYDNSPYVIYSSDGITWSNSGVNGVPGSGFKSIVYTGDKFVAIGSGGSQRAMTSTDGITWSGHTAAGNNYSYWHDLAYGGGRFVAVTYDGSQRIMYSDNGSSWTGVTAPEASYWWAVTHGNGRFVAIASSGTNRVMYSDNGSTWYARPAAADAYWQSVTYGDGKFVAVAQYGSGPLVMYSDDGYTWSDSGVTGANYGASWNSVTYGDGKFVAVGNFGANRAMYSSDGISWTGIPISTSGQFQEVRYVNDKFFAFAPNENIMMYSDDGITWSSIDSVGLTLADTTVSKASDGSLIAGESIDQVLTVGETVQADTTISSTTPAAVFDAVQYNGNSTHTGSGLEQVITTGIDNTQKSMIWFKNRVNGKDHAIFDTERTPPDHRWLRPNTAGVELDSAAVLKDRTTTGFTVVHPTSGSGTATTNPSSNEPQMVAWNFRAAPEFFDIQTYVGISEGAANQSQVLPHDLGSEPGMIIFKNLDAGDSWFVYHKDLEDNTWVRLNTNGVKSGPLTGVIPPTQTSTEFSIGADMSVNRLNENYVAYLFADTPGKIKCGTYTGNYSYTQTIDCGFEPGFVLIKATDRESDWVVTDYQLMASGQYFHPNNDQELKTNAIVGSASNGFTVASGSGDVNNSGTTHIYMAIARDVMMDITTQSTASGTVSASSGNTITLSDVSGTWSTGMKLQGTDSDTKDNPDPIGAQLVSLTSSAPTADTDVSTWGGAVWEIATDENFTQNVQTATAALSATGTQVGPSFALLPNTGYYTRTKYTALGNESEWSDVIHFVTASA